MDEPEFFHGTRRGFTPGGYLFPKSFHQQEDQTDAPTKPGMNRAADSDRFIYVTTSKTLAWVYAWHAPGRGRPKVLTVRPAGYIEADPEHSPAMQAYRVDGTARVLSIDFDPEMTEKEARAGWQTV